MKLISIPEERYEEYRLKAIFECYKWDPQFLDNNTVASHVLEITEEEYEEVAALTEKLDIETRNAEEFLNKNLDLAKPLALPKQIYNELKRMTNYDPKKHIRLMRYDFHPTTENKWAVSEVNSDVPGGFAEASLLPKLAIETLKTKKYFTIDFGEILADALEKKTKKNGTIAFVHCTSYSDDRQVMQFIGDKMTQRGFKSLYVAADHLDFENKKAKSILDNYEGNVDCIFRFTPLEWLRAIKPKTWDGYFDTTTPSCNHPIAIFAQTKRFPLVWDTLEENGIKLDTWRELLPETLEVKDAKNKEGFIYKPACGRVGEKISIKDACRDNEYNEILKEVKKYPKDYLAQKQFMSKPLIDNEGKEYHVCLGSYTVDGKHAGFYARISSKKRIDSDAADIPVIIKRSKKK